MTKTNIAGALSKKKFKASLSQSLLSLSFDIFGLLTGTLLFVYSGVFDKAPWAIILYPGILSVRGAIGGIFSAHLGTGLHLGTIKPVFTKNTRDFQDLLRIIVTLALVSGVTIGLATWLFGIFLWNATLVDFIYLMAVVIATMSLSVVFISPLTMFFSVFTYRRGLDPDVVVYPVTSPISDIINTSCYILSFTMFFLFGSVGRYLIWGLDIVFVCFVVYILLRSLKNKFFAQNIREFFLTLVFVSIIANVAGSLLNKISGNAIYRVYPAIIATIGGVGSIIGSTATTKLALGLIKPTFSSIKEHINEIAGSWLASVLMFVVYAILSLLISGGTTLIELLTFTLQLLTTNVLAVCIMAVIAYSVAIYTFRRGWNPDNFVIPIESALADTLTTAAIIIALILIV